MQQQDRMALVDKIIADAPTEQKLELRRYLYTLSNADLQKTAERYDNIHAEVRRQVENDPTVIAQRKQQIEGQKETREKFEELQLSRIFVTPVDGQIAVDTLANRSLIRSWITLDEQISPAWFVQVLKENPNLTQSLTWQTARMLDRKYREQLADAQELKDRETFTTFAKQNGFSLIEANYDLAQVVLNPGYDQNALADAVKSGRLRLAPASEKQLTQYAQEAAVARASYLRDHATPQELRDAVRMEADQRRQALQHADQERQIYGREVADSAFGFPPLPTHNAEGQVIDAAYLNRISNTNLDLFKALMRKHGAAALTRRLNGRG